MYVDDDACSGPVDSNQFFAHRDHNFEGHADNQA
jgi:hypothetical protein